MKRLLSVLCLLSSVLWAHATELTDLGQGLSYLRIHSVADSEVALRKAVSGSGALVLDLRYATANDESSTALKTSLTGRSPNTPLFILVSPVTPPVLGPVIRASAALTLGAPGSLPAPKIVVQTDAATDRHAYDALNTGTALEQLISGKIEKERFDESTLVQEFKHGNPDALPGDRPGQTPAGQQTGTVPTPDLTAAKSAGAPAKEPAAPLVDRILQRAVHLHRALLALRLR